MTVAAIKQLDTPEIYQRVLDMSEHDRQQILDPICSAVVGKADLGNGIEVMANRAFALLVLDLYQQWQLEVYTRE